MAIRHPLQELSKGERIVIVGNGENGAIAYECFRQDSAHEVVAFSADEEYIKSDELCGLPVVPFDRLAKSYPPDEHKVYIAISATALNRVRRRMFDAAKAAGYGCVSYVSSYAFAMPSVEIGENVFVQENVSLQHMTRIGDDVFIGAGTCIGHGSVVEDDCYFGPGATVCGNCRVGRSCFIGANSCIAHNVSVAQDCVVAAGAIIQKDTKTRQVYLGNPARPTGLGSFDPYLNPDAA